MMLKERQLGALWGFLIGDAVGVPYEFTSADLLPPMDQLEMTPPTGFVRSYPNIPSGTWSDDGAHVLCLLDSLIERSHLDLDHLATTLLQWYQQGKWAVDQNVFDIGIQTATSLRAFDRGVAADQAGFVRPDGKGNGSLMRVLSLALWHQGSDQSLIEDAHRQSLPTHGHILNQVCCALYALWVRAVLAEGEIEASYHQAVAKLRQYYTHKSEYLKQLEYNVRPDEEPVSDGGGYVVTTLQSVRIAVRQPDFRSVVQKAISLGEDTDTNAAIAGGLFGAKVGMNGLPKGWLEQMRGKELVGGLVKKWLG
ncbi:ADP-ribosylglycohydrolase family protein [Risungbinella massiliensis]|uniref:ADP-ribosylglycohydrolase family protein n=1 Tax=Risungbinella massiliensis TaxID=1329796 RepID=UPI0005CC6AB7|nr:ADP-ribosylglycohydrolase family protein [Risungbinella massiliensis]